MKELFVIVQYSAMGYHTLCHRLYSNDKVVWFSEELADISALKISSKKAFASMFLIHIARVMPSLSSNMELSNVLCKPFCQIEGFEISVPCFCLLRTHTSK
ncbi:hypothetical protein KP509_03G086400 [Ceratopteris richardii]|uniref:Uncharacterized protein n=1 Tax=Ceratopteris richardii TaxID=49495 RepID=A0A8T2V4Q2_CERRI|nr:hypothetical protein KP509_03G086400 [Ceratopteris richardii]